MHRVIDLFIYLSLLHILIICVCLVKVQLGRAKESKCNEDRIEPKHMLARSKEGVLDTFTISHLGGAVYTHSLWPLTRCVCLCV